MFGNKRATWFFFSILILYCSIYSENFRVFLHGHEHPPNYFTREDPGTGFFRDLFAEISTITGDTFTFYYLPSARGLLKFENGELDLEPGVNPIWRENSEVKGVYTIPYEKSKEVILSAKECTVMSPNDLIGKKVGIIRGYSYPSFDTLFASKEVIMQEYNEADQLLKLLYVNRVDFVFVNEAFALYSIKENPLYKDFRAVYEISSMDVMLRVHPNKKHALERINKALEQLLQSKTIEKLRSKYQ